MRRLWFLWDKVGEVTHNPALNPDALHAASRHSGRRLAPRWPFAMQRCRLLINTALALALSACALGPGHPRTWVYGVVSGADAAPLSGAVVFLYSGKTTTSANGCFKLQLSSALPLTLAASAPGHKAIEVPAKFGFYRVAVVLESSVSSKQSAVTWFEASESEVQRADCS